MATTTNTQIVAESPEVEAYKLALMKSATALQAPTLPGYQVAGLTPQQLSAIQMGQQGIGAYAPYLASANTNLTQGATELGNAADLYSGADTRSQFGGAQTALTNAAASAGQLGAYAQQAGQGIGNIGLGAQALQDAQALAASSANQPRFGGAGNTIEAAQSLANRASPSDFTGVGELLRNGMVESDAAVAAAQRAAVQPGFAQGIASLGQGAAQAAQAAQLGTAPIMEAAQMGPAQQVGAQNVDAQRINAAQMGPAERVGAQQVGTQAIEAAQMTPAQQIAARDINAAQMGPAQQITTKSFAQPGSADEYMSPYMQSVVEIQKREAARQSGIQGTQQQAQATQAGAFGGSRDAIMRAERERNLSQQMGDIQAQGSQAAYQQAQQQFNAEQQANLAAQQGNQQAGLTVGSQNLNAQQQAEVQNAANQLQANLANQQAGLTVNTQNLSAQQQANVQNAANQLQASGMTAQQALQAALANQQAGITVGSQNLTAAQQAEVQNAANQLQASGMNAQQAMQAALANQQAGITVGSQNLGAQQQAAAANQAMQGQYGLAGAQLGMQAANLTQNVGQGQMSAAQQQGQLGLAAAQQQFQDAGYDAATAMQMAQLQQTQQQQLLSQSQSLQGIGALQGNLAAQEGGMQQNAAQLMGGLGTQQAGLAGQYANVAGQQANITGQQSQLQNQIGQGIGSLAGQEFGIGAQMAQGIGSLGTQFGNLGTQQAALGQTAQQLGANDVNQLYTLGAVQQQQQQAVLDATRASDMQTALQPYQQLAFQSDIYKGAPSSQMAISSQQTPAPSPFQQIAGVGTGLVTGAAAASRLGLF
jgi:hypothetical protein